MKLTATTLQGLEQILEAELLELGAQNTLIQSRAVSFDGDKRTMYKANLHCRTAIRVLEEKHQFTCKTEFDLVNAVKRIPWFDYISTDNTFVVDTAGKHPLFNNTLYVSQKVKDVIADLFNDKFNERPSVDKKDPDLRINIFLSKDLCKIGFDSSGRSLHRRSYRIEETPAPISEVLAAGIILGSGWNKDLPFVDGMCGGGTIVIEAALIGNCIAPGIYQRKFGFRKWRDYEEELWEELVREAQAAENSDKLEIVGIDIDDTAILAAKLNAMNAEVASSIHIEQNDFFDFEPPPGPGIIVLNPPYGERLKDENLSQFYERIGDRLKQKYHSYDAWIISSNHEALKHIGLKTSQRLTVFNGPLECRLFKYQLYKGSRKTPQ